MHFSYCTSLKSVTYKGTSDPGYSSYNIFYYCPNLYNINVSDYYTGAVFCGISIKAVQTTENSKQDQTSIILVSVILAIVTVEVVVVVCYFKKPVANPVTNEGKDDMFL